MLRIFSVFVLILTASAAFANYGDVEGHLHEIRSTPVFLAEPIAAEVGEMATADICAMPLELMVSIPESFMQNDGVSVACLSE